MHLRSRSAKALAALAVSMATTLPVAATLPRGYMIDPSLGAAAFHDQGFDIHLNGTTWTLGLGPGSPTMEFSSAGNVFTMIIAPDGPTSCTLLKNTGAIEHFHLEDGLRIPALRDFMTALRQGGPVTQTLKAGNPSQRYRAELALTYCAKTEATGGIPTAAFLKDFIVAYRGTATHAPATSAPMAAASDVLLPVTVPAVPSTVPALPVAAEEESKAL